ncbi:unnamed protein product [Alternaria alternata]
MAGVIAICAAEGLSELTQLFPAPNAIVEYVRAFVDEDLAWVIGIAYWFTYSSIFATQNLAAANLAVYWGLTQVWQIVLFYFVTPGVLVAINLVGVGTFGWIEAIGGILKIMLVLGATIVLYVISAQQSLWSRGGPIQDGFKYNQDYTTNKYRALALGKFLHSFSVVVPKTGVPARALIFSAGAFLWLPFLSLKGGYAVQYVIEIFQISASVSCLIVWASISFAYLRYYIWLKHCDQNLVDKYQQFNRRDGSYRPFTVLAFLQPLPAIAAIAGCVIVFAFCSATWWDKDITFSKVAIGYASPIILFVLFVIFKLINRRMWIRTSDDFAVLSQTLDRLKWYKTDELDLDPQTQREEEMRVLSPPQVSRQDLGEPVQT